MWAEGVDFAALTQGIQAKASQVFTSQNRIVTLSVVFSQLEKDTTSNILEYALPDTFEDGYNTAKVTDLNGYRRTLEYWLTILEKIPVASHAMKPGDRLNIDDIELAWVPFRRITPFTYKENTLLIGMSLKYVKEKGQPFQDFDLMKPEVIKAQDSCQIVLKNGTITIKTPGIALKNGSIGSKIRVLNNQTKKVLEGTVLDSQNVEVRLD